MPLVTRITSFSVSSHSSNLQFEIVLVGLHLGTAREGVFGRIAERLDRNSEAAGGGPAPRTTRCRMSCATSGFQAPCSSVSCRQAPGRLTTRRPSRAVGQALQPIPFHIMVEGTCWLKMEGRHILKAGEVVAFPFGTGHQLGAGSGGRLIIPTQDLPPKPWREIPVLRYGEGPKGSPAVRLSAVRHRQFQAVARRATPASSCQHAHQQMMPPGCARRSNRSSPRWTARAAAGFRCSSG